MEISAAAKAELSGIIVMTSSEIVHENLEDVMQKVRIVCPRMPEHIDDQHLIDLVEMTVRRMVGVFKYVW